MTSDSESITYGALKERAQKIGGSLQEAGASPGSSIGLFCHPGIDAIAGMIGILLNRNGYVSMDPSFALERLAFMATDSKCEIILVGEELMDVAKETVAKMGVKSQTLTIPGLVSTEYLMPHLSASPHDPFYTIYTSVSFHGRLIDDVADR